MSLCPNPFSVMAFYLYKQLCLVHYAVINIVLACGEKCVCKSGKLGLSTVFMVLNRSYLVSNGYKNTYYQFFNICIYMYTNLYEHVYICSNFV